MPMPVARLGDSCGGTIIATAVTTLVNGLPVARIGDSITPHGKPPHTAAVITSGNPQYLVEGIPVARIGDSASCGHTITSGSPDHLA